MPICASQFIPDYHTQFTRPPADPASAFVPLGEAVDLDQLLAEDGERLVGRDNVVSFEGRRPAARQAAGAGGVARGCASRCGAISVASTPSGAARSAWAATTPRAGRWTAPAPDAPEPRPDPAAASFRPPARRTHARIWLQEAPNEGAAISAIPPIEAPPRRRRGPRLPVGPGE